MEEYFGEHAQFFIFVDTFVPSLEYPSYYFMNIEEYNSIKDPIVAQYIYWYEIIERKSSHGVGG